MARLQPLRDVFSLHCALASDFFSKLFSRAERGGKIEGFLQAAEKLREAGLVTTARL